MRTHDQFHGQEQKDSVIWKSGRDLIYSKLLLLFKIQIDEAEYPLAFGQDYTPIASNDLSEDDKATGFQRFSLGGMECTQFILPKNFIHGAFMVNTDDLHVNHYFLNDLVDPHMYLYLRSQQ